MEEHYNHTAKAVRRQQASSQIAHKKGEYVHIVYTISIIWLLGLVGQIITV